MKIFVSYRREDSIDATGRLHDALVREFGAKSVFVDVDSIPPGVDFRKHLREKLSLCDVALVMIGENWLPTDGSKGRLFDDDDFVRIEVEVSLRGGFPVIPVLVGNAKMPPLDALPDTLQDLVYRNAVRLRPNPDFHHDVSRLIQGLKTPASSVWEDARKTKVPIPTTNPKWLAIGGAVLAFIVVVAILLLRPSGPKDPRDDGEVDNKNKVADNDTPGKAPAEPPVEFTGDITTLPSKTKDYVVKTYLDRKWREEPIKSETVPRVLDLGGGAYRVEYALKSTMLESITETRDVGGKKTQVRRTVPKETIEVRTIDSMRAPEVLASLDNRLHVLSLDVEVPEEQVVVEEPKADKSKEQPKKDDALVANKSPSPADIKKKNDAPADKQADDPKRQSLEELLDLQISKYGKNDWHVTDAELALAKHDHLSKLSSEQKQRLKEAEELNTKASALYNDSKQYAQAAEMYNQVFNVFKEILGETRDTALASNSVGLCLYSQSKYAEAVPYFAQALEIEKNVLKENHPYTGTRYNNLGDAYYWQGKYPQAAPMHQKAREIRKLVYGTENADYASSVEKVGNALEKAVMTEADPKLLTALRDARKENLTLQERKYKAGDWHLADAKAALAMAESLEKMSLDQRHELWKAYEQYQNAYALYNNSKYSDAASEFKQAIEIYERLRVGKTRDVAFMCNYLGNCLYRQSQYTDAIPWYEKALALDLEVWNEDYPGAVTQYINLGDSLYALEKYSESVPPYQKSVEIRKRTLGDQDPDYLTALQNVAGALDKATTGGGTPEQWALLKQTRTEVLRINTKKYGPGDYRVADARLALATSETFSKLDTKQRATFKEAEASYQKALTAYNNKQYGDAAELFTKALQGQKESLGEKARKVGLTSSWLANSLYGLGKYEEARSLYEAALAIDRSALQENHPDTATDYNNLADDLYELTRYSEALPNYTQAKAIRKAVLGEQSNEYLTSTQSLANTLEKIAAAEGTTAQWKALHDARVEVFELNKKRYPEGDWHVKDAELAIAAGDKLGSLTAAQRAKLVSTYQVYLDALKDYNASRYAEAAPKFESTIKVYKEILGPKSRKAGLSMSYYGNCLQNTNKYAETLEPYAEALVIDQELLGENHPDTATDYMNLANSYFNLRKFTDAAPLYRRAVAIRKIVLGEQNDVYKSTVDKLAENLERMAAQQ